MITNAAVMGNVNQEIARGVAHATPVVPRCLSAA